MLRREGVIDAQVEGFIKIAASPLQSHVDVFESEMKAEGPSKEYIEASLKNIDRMLHSGNEKTGARGGRVSTYLSRASANSVLMY